MPTKKTHIKQHTIPSSYLKNWADPAYSRGSRNFIWIYAIDGSSVRKSSPHSAFIEKDFYTVHSTSGDRDLSIEQRLAKIEGLYADLHRKKLSRNKPLTSEDRAILSLFVASLNSRTPQRREYNRNNWQHVLDVGNTLIGSRNLSSPINKNTAPDFVGFPINITDDNSFTLDDVKHFVDKPIQSFLESEVYALASVIAKMKFTFLRTAHRRGFITTDTPVFITDPYLGKNGFRGLAFKSQTIQVTCPLSPNLSVLITHNNDEGYYSINNLLMEDINRAHRFNAYKEFVVNSKSLNKYWFSIFSDARLLRK